MLVFTAAITAAAILARQRIVMAIIIIHWQTMEEQMPREIKVTATIARVTATLAAVAAVRGTNVPLVPVGRRFRYYGNL